ncbi:hypothetical protein KR018_002329 [Drosophila ironensis]|nr:hypothetical protein KR018_002329 [Drosophila ironensis]
MSMTNLFFLLAPTLLPVLASSLRCSLTAGKSGIWSVNESNEVQCTCETAPAFPQSLVMERRLMQSKTTLLNNTEIRNGSLVAKENGLASGWYVYLCLTKDALLASTEVRVWPDLRTLEIDCRLTGSMLSCTFLRPEHSTLNENTKYSLGDGDAETQCEDIIHTDSEMSCNLNLTNAHFDSYNLTLSMRSTEVPMLETYMFVRHSNQIKVPQWGKNGVNVTRVGNQTCLHWPHANRAFDSPSMEWRVMFQPLNPALDSWDVLQKDTLQDDLVREDFCFDTPQQAYEKFVVQLKRHFLPHGPWSEPYPKAIVIETPSTVPSRPPRFWPIGFTYHANRDLQVFWEQLHPADFNGPNITYFLRSSDGNNATLVSTMTAIFPQWNSEKEATVTVWSQNAVGSSHQGMSLRVPRLHDAERRSPKNVYLNETLSLLTWSEPEEKMNLRSYIVYWCAPSSNMRQICNDTESVKWERVQDTRYEFRTSTVLLKVAVAADYADSAGSGGLVWLNHYGGSPQEIRNLQPKTKVAIVVLVIVILSIVPLIRLKRKLDRCDDIEPVFPENIQWYYENLLQKKKVDDLPHLHSVEPVTTTTFPGSMRHNITYIELEFSPVAEDATIDEVEAPEGLTMEAEPIIMPKSVPVVSPYVQAPAPYVQINPNRNVGYINPPPPRQHGYMGYQ